MAKGKYEQWLTEDSLTKLEAWARDGLTDEQIASNVGITAKTLYEWKAKYRGICNALKKGKEVVDIQVENALFKRAIGYRYEEVTTEEGPDGVKSRKVVKKEMPPDTTAQIFWLKNRKPKDWRDKRDVGIDGNINTSDPLAGMSVAEKIEYIKKTAREAAGDGQKRD